MTNTFETTLDRIMSQQSTFESLDERAVEIGVVLPLLRRVGWNTEDVSEIYPQRGLSDGSKVDYDLQISGESRILIEVKRWAHTLNDEDEGQLAGYCRLALPSLAVLTSGRNWRMYLPPIKRKNAQLRRFCEFDITDPQSMDVASTFREFLARDRMSDVKRTIAAAVKLHKESQEYRKFKTTFTEALSELANDKKEQAKLLQVFAENKGMLTSPENIGRFIESLHGSLVNEVPTVKSRKKPASFVLPASLRGKSRRYHRVGSPIGWNKLLLEVCRLMQKRHPESFHKEILSVTDRFAEVKDSNFDIPVDGTGVFAKWGLAGEIREACYTIVTKFGYRRDSLEIKDSSGAIL